MLARFPGNCQRCGERIPKGEECDYDPIAKKIRHYNCPRDIGGGTSGPYDEVESGSSGKDLAERLGFVDHAEGMASGGAMFLLPRHGRGNAARR